jgi:rod shape-determining protein MreC
MRRDDRPILGPGGFRGGPDPLDDRERRDRRARTVLVVLLLASFIVITLDARRPDDSPVGPLKVVAGAVFGPLENGAAAVMSPVTRVTDYFGDVEQLNAANDALRQENERLRSRLRTAGFARQRNGELDRLLDLGRQRDDRLVPAEVTAMGGGQTFSRTVTIDAGRDDGVRPDMTVLNPQGLVGRVIAASGTSATVLLVIDPDSVVGGRLGRSMELGFISGEGDIGEQGRLRMQLVDRATDPKVDDTIVTWGSRHGAPYVAGVPIGSVERVITSPRELSKTVVVRPYVDFSSLDMVGVVVGSHGPGARTRADARGDAGRGVRGGAG